MDVYGKRPHDVPMNQKTLAPLDLLQRYTIPETCEYLRCSRARVYTLIRDGSLKTIKDGRRRYVTGSEIAKRSGAGA